MICWLASESDECDKDHQPINNVKSEVKVMHFHRNYQRCSQQQTTTVTTAYLSTDVWHLCVRGEGAWICQKFGKIFTCFLFVLLGGLALAYQSSPSCYLCFIIGLCLGIFAQKHMSILPIKSQYESIHFPQLQSEPHSMLSISSDGGLN